MNAIPSFDFQIQFLKYIQWLLEMSSYTATYKFALLMSLVNSSIESAVNDDLCLFISYHHIADHFIQLYWSQSLPYAPKQVQDGEILKQLTGGQASVIKDIIELRTIEPNINKAKVKLASQWHGLRKKVASNIKRNPAQYLQTPEKNIHSTFLYDYHAHTNGIELKQGIAYCFAHYSVIINKLCQQYWTEFIRKNNQSLFSDIIDLQQFLFGELRQNLSIFLPLLSDLQDNRCFYCGSKLTDFTKTAEVDHFIPWSKYPNDTAHNFVLADHKCNNAKRDYLAHTDFFEKWNDHNHTHGSQIHDYAMTHNFFTNLPQTQNVGAWAYQMAIENNDLIWLPPKKLESIDLTFNPNF